MATGLEKARTEGDLGEMYDRLNKLKGRNSNRARKILQFPLWPTRKQKERRGKHISVRSAGEWEK